MKVNITRVRAEKRVIARDRPNIWYLTYASKFSSSNRTGKDIVTARKVVSDYLGLEFKWADSYAPQENSCFMIEPQNEEDEAFFLVKLSVLEGMEFEL
jgi:hypothetical protein